MSLPWFRFYHEFAGDPVVQSLAFEDQRHYVVLMCFMGAGLLNRAFDVPEKRDEVIAKGLGLDRASALEAKRRLMDVGLILGDWTPRGWEKRQFKSDNSAERVKKYRQNKQLGDVTGFDRYSNGLEQSRTDTETEQKRVVARKRPAPTPIDTEFLSQLQAEECYRELDVGRIFGKMRVYCEARGKVPTRRRLIDWLNREDRPMKANGVGGPTARGVEALKELRKEEGRG